MEFRGHPNRTRYFVAIRTAVRGIGFMMLSFSAIACSDSGRREGEEDVSSTHAVGTFELAEPAAFSVSSGDSTAGATPFLIATGSHSVILHDGRVVVENKDELIYLDSAGRGLAVVGRQGAGPGEFEFIRRLFEAESGVGVFDSRHRRVTTFSGAGVLKLSIPLNESARGFSAVGWFDGVGPVASKGGIGGTAREFAVLDTNGDLAIQMGALEPFPDLQVSVVSDGFSSSRSPAIECTPVSLERVIGGVLYAADQGKGRIVAFSRDAPPRTVYESAHRGRVTQEILDNVSQSFPGAAANDIAQLLAKYGKIGDPLPFTWDNMVADPEGRLWLRLGKCERAAKEWQWEIVDTTGAYRGTISTSSYIQAVRHQRAVIRVYNSSVPHIELKLIVAPVAK